jgi:putative SOS response-associated peptidase YedK
MPVILHPQEFDQWLDRDLTEYEELKQVFQPYPADLMDIYQVSTTVNSPRNDSPELIKPLAE